MPAFYLIHSLKDSGRKALDFIYKVIVELLSKWEVQCLVNKLLISSSWRGLLEFLSGFLLLLWHFSVNFPGCLKKKMEIKDNLRH